MILPPPLLRVLFPLSFERYFSLWLDAFVSYESPQAVWARTYIDTYKAVIR